MRRTFLFTLVALTLLAILVFVLPRLIEWPGWPLAILIVFAVMLFFMVRWHARHIGYECPKCMHRFAVSAMVDFLSPHTTGKLLRCPHCGVCSWCREIDRAMISQQEKALPSSPLVGASRSLYVQIMIVFGVYALLWINAAKLMKYPSAGESDLDILKIPLATGVLMLLHLIFTGFAIRQKYRSAIYPVVTIFVLAFLATALWTQYRIMP